MVRCVCVFNYYLTIKKNQVTGKWHQTIAMMKFSIEIKRKEQRQIHKNQKSKNKQKLWTNHSVHVADWRYRIVLDFFFFHFFNLLQTQIKPHTNTINQPLYKFNCQLKLTPHTNWKRMRERKKKSRKKKKRNQIICMIPYFSFSWSFSFVFFFIEVSSTAVDCSTVGL